MTAAEIVKQLEPLGAASYRKVLFNHGVREPVLGVKIEALKQIQKAVRKDHALALELYDTGIYDAQYLAGLIADETKITAAELRHWMATGNCPAPCATTVAWLAAESPHGRQLALEWIDSTNETAAQTGWATLSSLVAVTDDSQLDLAELAQLL